MAEGGGLPDGRAGPSVHRGSLHRPPHLCPLPQPPQPAWSEHHELDLCPLLGRGHLRHGRGGSGELRACLFVFYLTRETVCFRPCFGCLVSLSSSFVLVVCILPYVCFINRSFGVSLSVFLSFFFFFLGPVTLEFIVKWREMRLVRASPCLSG